MDEISISDITYCAKVEDGKYEEFIIDPREFGFKLASKDQIKGKDAIYNAQITKDILNGTIKDAKRDIVILNTAVALVVDGKAASIEDGIKMANEAIDSNKAYDKLQQIILYSNMLC